VKSPFMSPFGGVYPEQWSRRAQGRLAHHGRTEVRENFGLDSGRWTGVVFAQKRKEVRK
jgi:hypothetical protein